MGDLIKKVMVGTVITALVAVPVVPRIYDWAVETERMQPIAEYTKLLTPSYWCDRANDSFRRIDSRDSE